MKKDCCIKICSSPFIFRCYWAAMLPAVMPVQMTMVRQ